MDILFSGIELGCESCLEILQTGCLGFILASCYGLFGEVGCFVSIFIILLFLSILWYSFPLTLMLLRFIGKIFIHSDDEDDIWKQIVLGIIVLVIVGFVINYWESLSEWFKTIFATIGNH